MNQTIRVDFLCGGSGGRGRTAAAFAQREVRRRHLHNLVEVHVSSDHPSSDVGSPVVEQMANVGLDIAAHQPTPVAVDEFTQTDYLVRMDCPLPEFDPTKHGVQTRAWNIPSLETSDVGVIREIRDQLRRQVVVLFDDISTTMSGRICEDRQEDVTLKTKNTL